MKRRSIFVLVSIIALGGFVMGQRTVTNDDLSRYKDQRVRAESELRNNYARLGFPSPEELERREAERNRQREELASRLRQQEVEDARMLLQYQMALAAARPQTIVIQTDGYDDGSIVQYGGFGGYGGFGFGGFGHRFRPRQTGFFPQQGYYAGGQFWPTGPSTPVAPMFRVGGRRH